LRFDHNAVSVAPIEVICHNLCPHWLESMPSTIEDSGLRSMGQNPPAFIIKALKDKKLSVCAVGKLRVEVQPTMGPDAPARRRPTPKSSPGCRACHQGAVVRPIVARAINQLV
jgi:hypothetical protein